jgi:hypothetical protein
MRREDFVFCIGFEGSTAIVDGRLQRKFRSYSTSQLAEAGLFKPALCSAIYSGRSEELEEVLSLYNNRTSSAVRSVEELQRTFGTFGVPEGVKKVTVV